MPPDVRIFDKGYCTLVQNETISFRKQKMQNCPDFEKNDIFHIYIIWTIHINHLKSHMSEVIDSV